MLYSVEACIAVTLAQVILSWVATLLRGYVRIFIVKNFGLDDWFAFAALIIATVCGSTYLYGMWNGLLDRNMLDMGGVVNIERGFKVVFVEQLTYCIASNLIKISFAITLLRIVQKPYQKVILKIVIVFAAASMIAFSLDSTLGCSPVHYFWTQALDPYMILTAEGVDAGARGYTPKGTCTAWHNALQVSYLSISELIFTDMVLGIVLPILLIKDLMSKTLKLQAGLILGMSCFASIASIARMPYVHQISVDEFFKSSAPFIFWSGVELAWCMIATSCTMLKPLVTRQRGTDIETPKSSERYGSGKKSESVTAQIEDREWDEIEDKRD